MENALKFTPLEFETWGKNGAPLTSCDVKIYSVGV